MKFKVIIIIILLALVIAGVISAGIYIKLIRQQKAVITELNLAEKALREKRLEEAKSHLQTVVQRYGRSVAAPRACYLLTKIYFDSDDLDSALSYSELLLNRYPQSEFSPWAEYYRAEVLLQRDKKIVEAKEIFVRLAGERREEIADWAELSLAKTFLEEGKLKEAKKRLIDLYGKEKLPEDLKDKIEDSLGKVNIELLFSPEIEEGDQLYTLQRGDTLWELARKFKLTEEILMRSNDITNPRLLKIGRQLKLPLADFSIVVDKTRNVLILYNGGKFLKKYRVRTGKYDYLTPAGEYKIEFKKKDPEWLDPRTNKRYPPGDPGNELGTRWLAFKGTALGIHGTIHPESIGEYASYGCVGMLMPEVEELYDIVPEGTPVKIIGKIQESAAQEKNE